MSSAASISAAKKRRANQLQPPMQPPMQQPPMQRPMTAPSLANLTPAQRQQFLMQQQQHQQQQQQQQQKSRMQQQQQQQQQPPQQQQQQNRKSSQKQTDPKSGLTWPIPPIYLMKQMDNMLFQQSQSIDELKNRLNCIETGSFSESGESGLPGFSAPELDLEQIKSELMSDTDFVSGIVDNIMNNSNLSEIIEQIDTVQAENRELRDLFHAQQKTINEMNIMLLKLITQSLSAAPAAVVQAKAISPISAQSFESAATIVSASSTLVQNESDVADDADHGADDNADHDADDDDTNNIQLDVVDNSDMQTVD